MAGYGSDEAFEAWATAAGHELPDGQLSAARQRGSTYIDALYGDRFTGAPTAGVDQDRAWPRTGASAYGSALASDLVPARVVNASYEAALIELRAPGSLTIVTDPAKRVKRQKVDTIEREFFEPGDIDGGGAPVSSVIEGLLAPLLAVEAPGIGIWGVCCRFTTRWPTWRANCSHQRATADWGRA